MARRSALTTTTSEAPTLVAQKWAIDLVCEQIEVAGTDPAVRKVRAPTVADGYQSIPSLTDYLLISQKNAHIEHFARETDGTWRYRLVKAGGSVTLTTGDVIQVDDVYDGVFDLSSDEN